MIETSRPPQNTRREIITLSSDGADLALHLWRPRRIKGAVFFFHGLRSHAGWLWEAGPRFADNDIAFFVLDRRGSGISTGARQEIPDVGTVIADYVHAVAHVREYVGEDAGENVPLSLFGHGLGGSFLAALMHHPDFTTRYEAAVFCSAWLGRLHATLDDTERAALAAERSTELWDTGPKASDFTDDAVHRHFIDNDDLAVRSLTRRSRARLLGLERLYLEPRRELPDIPAVFVSGLSDPLVDLDAAHRAFTTMVSGRGTIIQFPTDRHFLFHTPVSGDLIDWASTHTLLQGLDRGA
ncbi:serine aminopeptidase domain-containing protein [Streptomyces sp. UNOC14_S4]|uniref:serine aminopeptidase domain-containing protein n=1 Tax=Streptomyces sp. UNOC14_S4 TaxID=2872340 RepID=UPI001E55CA41|nr:alpha/beta hydrolase [Streptomyces sp. UNOC14_S4]MCC3767424.1 lysophospholipase [Streptomyces sp. UNOC14_S4]